MISLNYFSVSLSAGFMSILTSVGGIAIALLLLLLLITIHELGHYTMGKLLGFKINEFAVGFGKVLWSKVNNKGEKVSLRAFPLGGYCAFEGEDESSDSSTAFNNQAPWKRVVVLLGGVLFNFLSAIIFSIFLIAIIGNGTTQINDVIGPNAVNGLQQGDVIVAIEDEKPKFINGGVVALTSEYEEGQEFVMTVEHSDGTVEDVTVYKYMYTPSVTSQEPYLSLGLSLSYVDYSVGQAIVKSVPFSVEMAGDFFKIIGNLFIGQTSLDTVGGPITAVSSIGQSATTNMLSLLLLLPVLSINLAVFNILPIPALDGARIVFVIIEWIRKKPIDREVEGKIHMAGLILLFGLVILIDMLHLFIY